MGVLLSMGFTATDYQLLRSLFLRTSRFLAASEKTDTKKLNRWRGGKSTFRRTRDGFQFHAHYMMPHILVVVNEKR